ncbi:MAG: tetratricopeptide repeat protein [Planctomycetota bacterium]
MHSPTISRSAVTREQQLRERGWVLEPRTSATDAARRERISRVSWRTPPARGEFGSAATSRTADDWRDRRARLSGSKGDWTPASDSVYERDAYVHYADKYDHGYWYHGNHHHHGYHHSHHGHHYLWASVWWNLTWCWTWTPHHWYGPSWYSWAWGCYSPPLWAYCPWTPTWRTWGWYWYAPPVSTTVVYEPAKPLPTLADAWGFLAEGLLFEARNAFGELVAWSPDYADARVGYALVLARLEQHDLAVEQMRTAVRADASALRRVPVGPSLDTQVEAVLAAYRPVVIADESNLDALFMVAAMAHILGDHTVAYFSIDTAIERGDADPAAKALRSVIEAAAAGEAFSG